MALLLLAVSPISSSLLQSPFPETNLCLTLIKVKILQLLYKKTPRGRLSVILQLVTTCPLLRFYCIHVYFLTLKGPSHPILLLLLPSIDPVLSPFPHPSVFLPPPPSPPPPPCCCILLFVCACLTQFCRNLD